jgi:hypothetical protein
MRVWWGRYLIPECGINHAKPSSHVPCAQYAVCTGCVLRASVYNQVNVYIKVYACILQQLVVLASTNFWRSTHTSLLCRLACR